MDYKTAIKDFIVPKVKFGLTSSLATAIDYGIYISFTMFLGINESVAHAISYSTAMIINFLMQKRFIFKLQRKVGYAFGLSVMFSLVGWTISQAFFNFFILTFGFFATHDILAKLLVTGIIFLYNFYTKRYSFEKKHPLQK
jgi:putative flippase GtrA